MNANSLRWTLSLVAVSAFASEPGYVDPLQCRECHQGIFDSYQQTGMGRSFAKAGSVPALNDFVHEKSGRRYSVVQRDGAGNHSKTFVHRSGDGHLLELPVSWYAERGGYWAMSPGYDRVDHSDLSRTVSESCLFCHNGYPSKANDGLALGIDCQRCHGPGEAHVTKKGTIVNPAKLDSDRQMEVCLQCHLESASRTLPDAVRRFNRTVYSYRPGEPLADYKLFFDYANKQGPESERITVNNSAYGLLKSPCFQKSGTMRCTTCHDPHIALRGEQATQHFSAICRSCHKAAHTVSTDNCAGCHMQKRRTEDAVHVVMADHHIRRHPLQGDQLAPIAEKHERQYGPVKLLYPDRLSDTPESRLYTALAQIRASANLHDDIPRLERAIKAFRPMSAESYTLLAEAYKMAGRIEEAIGAYRIAIRHDPEDATTYVAISDLLLANGKVKEALALVEPATRKIQTSGPLWNSLSVLLARSQRFNDALTAVSQALQIDSDDPVSWLNLGVCLHAKGDKKGAEAAYRQALLLQPNFVRAQNYLKLVLEDKL